MSLLRIGIAVIITVIWAAAYSISFIDHSFTAPPELSGVFLAVITWLFGSEMKNAIKGKGDAP